MKLRLSRRAKADVAEIAAYTVRKWGNQQAIDYARGLDERLMEVIAKGLPGTETEGVDPSLRRIRYRFHYAFFKRVGDDVLVLRVLHHAMDIASHLR